MAFNPAELSLLAPLPAPFTPTGRYRAVVVQGGFAFVSGQLPRVDGELRYRGTVGVDLCIEEARDAARLCASHCLAVLDRELGGLHRLIRIVRVTGYVACHASFFDHADVIDAASDYLVGALGDAGAHSRTSIGVVSLPRHAPVELDLIAAIQP